MEDFLKELDRFFILLVFTWALFGMLVGFLIWFKERSTPRKLPYLAGWNLIITVFLLISVLLIGETHYRFFVDRTDAFAMTKLATRWGQRHYQYNNLRARDKLDYDYRIAKGKKRLTILGDSFATGHGIEQVDDRFGNRLRSLHPDMEVHVMAANGMESVDELFIIDKLASEGYEFDIVLLTYCMNDVSYLLEEADEVYRQIEAFDKGLGFFGRNSYCINNLQFRWFARQNKGVRDYFRFVKKGYSGGYWQQHQQTLKAINNHIGEFGGRLAVVTFPFLHNLGEGYELKDAHQNLKMFWKMEGVPHLDLTAVLSQHDPEELVVNKYDAHPNEYANQLAADAIENWLFEKRIGP